jgi:polysaccharide chain length determinant protein (PEP-CTERM system associated)
MLDSSSPDFDFKRYLGILERRRYLALAVALAVLSLFTWGSFLMSKTYEASATVSIESVGIIKPLIQGVGVSVSMEERQRNIQNRVTSRSVIERVIKKLGLDKNLKTPGQDDELATGIQKSIKVTMRSFGDRESDLFTVSYRGSDPRFVRDLVETLVKEFIEDSVRFQRSDAVGAYEFIDGQLQEYKKKLELSDKAIREFRERNPHMVPQNESTVIGRIENFQTARIDGEIRLKELIRKRESLQKQLTGEKELTVAFVSREGSPESRLNYLDNQLMLLMTKYTDNYPEVIKVKSEIEELQKQIAQASNAERNTSVGSEMRALNPVYRQIKEEMQRTDTEIESLKARLEELAKQQDLGRQVLGRMPKEQEEWSKLQRDRNVFQKIYDDLLQKLENARVSRNLELADKSTTYRVVDPPLLPRIPIKPNRVFLIMAGLVLGIGAGVGAAVVLDYYDDSFKDENTLREGLNLPILAAVPSIVTEADVLAEAMLDKKVFTATVAYLSLIGLVLMAEILYRLGITSIHF